MKSLGVIHIKGWAECGHTREAHSCAPSAFPKSLTMKTERREGPRVSRYLNPSLWLSLRWQVPPCRQGFWRQVLMGIVQSFP